jgi:hypothetical protein
MSRRSRGMTGSAPLDLVIDGLATHRIARIIVTDEILDGPRAHVMQALHEAGWEKGKTLLRCTWCVGVWVALGVTVARRTCPRAWAPVAYGLALADAAGIINSTT